MLGGDGQPLFGQNPTFSTYGSWHVMTCHDKVITNSDCKSENQSNAGFAQGDVWRHLHCLGHGAQGWRNADVRTGQCGGSTVLALIFAKQPCSIYFAEPTELILKVKSNRQPHTIQEKEHIFGVQRNVGRSPPPEYTGISVYTIDDKSRLMPDICI